MIYHDKGTDRDGNSDIISSTQLVKMQMSFFGITYEFSITRGCSHVNQASKRELGQEGMAHRTQTYWWVAVKWGREKSGAGKTGLGKEPQRSTWRSLEGKAVWWGRGDEGVAGAEGRRCPEDRKRTPKVNFPLCKYYPVHMKLTSKIGGDFWDM